MIICCGGSVDKVRFPHSYWQLCYSNGTDSLLVSHICVVPVFVFGPIM